MVNLLVSGGAACCMWALAWLIMMALGERVARFHARVVRRRSRNRNRAVMATRLLRPQFDLSSGVARAFPVAGGSAGTGSLFAGAASPFGGSEAPFAGPESPFGHGVVHIAVARTRRVKPLGLASIRLSFEGERASTMRTGL